MIASLYQLYEKYPDISTDTRNILPQSIFFCLKGENFNGNTFARQALANGAAYVVSDDSANLDLPNTIIVPNVLETLQQLALYHRKQLAIPVIGITGTNGKTTTKELVNAVLSQHYKTACTKGNFNNHIGVPLTLLSIRSNDEIAVVEMGANHAGEIAELCDLALPTAGIVTNIGKAHLEGFGSIEHIIETKTALYRSVLQNNGQIFINIDDPILTGYFETLGIFDANHGNPPSTPFSCYSQFNKEVVHGSVICQNPCLKINLFGEKVNTNMTGAYNIYNILSAVAVGIHFGITKTQIIHALQSYIPDNNRSQVVAKNGMTLIADYYNANPTSMEAALRNLASLEEAKKYAILGDMLELGESSPDEHKRVIELCQELNIPTFFIGCEFAKHAGMNNFFFKNIEDFNRQIDMDRFRDATILVKGSRGLKLELTNIVKYIADEKK